MLVTEFRRVLFRSACDWWLGPRQKGVGALSGEAVLSRLVARAGTKGRGPYPGGVLSGGGGLSPVYIALRPRLPLHSPTELLEDVLDGRLRHLREAPPRELFPQAGVPGAATIHLTTSLGYD